MSIKLMGTWQKNGEKSARIGGVMTMSKQHDANVNDASFLGTGWSFPPSFEKANHLINMTSAKNNIKQSIDLILQTPCGARSMMPEFGSRLHLCLFRTFDTSLEAEIKDVVESALLDFEPRIAVENVVINSAHTQDNPVRIKVLINYRVKMTNSRDNHVYPFNLSEATDLVIKGGV